MSLLPPVTYTSTVNFQIGQLPPPDVKDPATKLAFTQVYKAIQQLILLTQPGNAGGNTLGIVASELIAYGASVNLFNNSGKLNVRNANSSTTKPCHGFCTALAGIALGSTGNIDLGTAIINTTGLTLGSNYYLAPANGTIQLTPDTTAGHIEQFIGIALSATQLFVKPGSWIQH